MREKNFVPKPRKVASLLLAIAVMLGCITMPKQEVKATGPIDSYNFTFRDCQGTTQTFNGKDGKPSIIILSNNWTYGATKDAIGYISDIMDGSDTSAYTVYAIDINGSKNPAIDVSNIVSKYNSSIITGYAKSGSDLYDLYYTCYMAAGKNGEQLYMPIIVYKNADGTINATSTNSTDKVTVKMLAEAIGIKADSNKPNLKNCIIYDVKYGQSVAREQTAMINAFRKSADAWYWNSDNATKTYKTGLSDLKYDYELEKVAMLRAAEIAYSFSHTRPNGESFSSACADFGFGFSYVGENIAYGYRTTSDVFVGWREDNEDYSGQGHRRNMLNENYDVFAVGHCYYNGRDYWVQEFACTSNESAYTQPDESNRSVPIEVPVGTPGSSMIDVNSMVNNPDSNVDPSTLHCKWYTKGGKSYWYENGVRQGTYDDPNGVMGDGSIRGREICDMESAGWYWLDSVYDGAKATNKEVWMPYIYQQEARWDDAEIRQNANASDPGMVEQVYRDIKAHTGKWVRYDENGAMYKGWYTVEGQQATIYPKQAGNTYYYDQKTGLMAKGDTMIDGIMYHFDETTGVLQK